MCHVHVLFHQYLKHFFYSSFHIVFAILEVLRNDFSDIYDKILPHQELFPLFHYPAYRWVGHLSLLSTLDVVLANNIIKKTMCTLVCIRMPWLLVAFNREIQVHFIRHKQTSSILFKRSQRILKTSKEDFTYYVPQIKNCKRLYCIPFPFSPFNIFVLISLFVLHGKITLRPLFQD